MGNRPLLLHLVVLTCAATAGSPALATLGRTSASVDADRVALSASVKSTTTRGPYTVVELTSDAQTIREYIAADSGIVFAVSWSGLVHADLSRLLGSYFADYQGVLQRTPRVLGRRQHALKSDRIVVELWGHQRKLQGRAFDPRLVPSGADPNEIQ